MVTITDSQSLWQEIESRRVVLMSLDDYEALVDRLEELEDALELRQAVAEAGDLVPFDEMVMTIQSAPTRDGPQSPTEKEE